MHRRRLALLVTLAAVVAAVTGAAPAGARAHSVLVQAASCGAPAATVAGGASTGSTGSTAVSFTVPATTWLRVRHGRVVGAATNTRCAPRPTDTFVVGGRPAAAAEIAAALGRFRTGNWTTPGHWHRPG